MPLILIVEDDEDLMRNLTKFLASEGYQTVSACGECDAKEALKNGDFDCVLLDLSLKDGNGFSVCSYIKDEMNIPVIFLTASSDESCTVAGFNLGADDYISKPFRPRELLARIKNAMRKYNKTETVYRCGNVVLDQTRGMASKNGQDLYLSALEYRLLLILMSNKEKLMSRDRIADELWSYSGEFVSDNTLNVYMKRLREKVEDDPQHPQIIITVRGLGYKAVDR
ncbi:MAG TPA: response regulator transcription factor [Ruminococcus sp.]|nr:response regulator transcription factor [Ruminococcus sp.]